MDRLKSVINSHNKVSWKTGEIKQCYKLIKSKHGWVILTIGVTMASMGVMFVGNSVSADTTNNTSAMAISQLSNNTSSNDSKALESPQNSTNIVDDSNSATVISTSTTANQNTNNSDTGQKVTPVTIPDSNKDASADKMNTSKTEASGERNNKQNVNVRSNNSSEITRNDPDVKKDDAINNESSIAIPTNTQSPTPDLIHVQWGDTLTKYANEYHTTVDAIYKLNGLRDANLIYAGDWIYVPGGRSWVTEEERFKYNAYDRYLNGNDNSFLELNVGNDNLPNGLSITSTELGTPDNNNFNEVATLSVKTTVNINSASVSINPGDNITFKIANDTSMKSVIDWSKITINSDANVYGHWVINANDGVVNYIFDKRISLTTGSLDLIINVPFMKNDSVKQANDYFSETFKQDNNNYNIKDFKYSYTYVDDNVSYARVQAPSTGSGLDYATVSPYNGPTANGAVSYNGNNHSIYDYSKGDEPSFCNVIYPTNADPDPKFNTLTNRTYTTEIKGNGASFDINSLMFGLPADLPYAVSWGEKYDGQWITLDQLKELLPGINITLDQINANDAKLIIVFPNGVPIQYLQYTGNFIAPDVSDTYSINFGYHDDQNTDSNNSIDMTFNYETSNQGFFPSINAQNKTIDANNFDKTSLNKYLLDGVSSSDVQDGTKDAVEIYNNSSLVSALNSDTPGVYNVTYKVTNSLGLTSYKTIKVRVYLGQKITDTSIGQKTIHYVDSNGKAVAPDKVITVHYTRIGIKDTDTGNIIWGSWTTTDDPNYDIKSPEVANMTPDQTDVKGTITKGENDITTVVYTESSSNPINKNGNSGNNNVPVNNSVDTNSQVNNNVNDSNVNVSNKQQTLNKHQPKNTKNNLPDTGQNADDTLLGLVGTIVLAILGFFGLGKINKSNY